MKVMKNNKEVFYGVIGTFWTRKLMHVEKDQIDIDRSWFIDDHRDSLDDTNVSLSYSSTPILIREILKGAYINHIFYEGWSLVSIYQYESVH